MSKSNKSKNNESKQKMYKPNKRGTFQLLYELYTIHSPTRNESKMRDFLLSWLKKYGIPHYLDKKTGCIFYLNPHQPLLSAHMDQVQREAPSFDDLRECGDRILAPGFGLGADDKNGIWIILSELYLGKLNQEPMPSFILSTSEECASENATACFERNFLDADEKPLVPFALVLDRRGKGDIIGFENGYCSLDFESKVEEISDRNQMGYKRTQGVYSDADGLSNYINCVNLSVGYYNAHTIEEETSRTDLMRAWNFVRHLLKARDELAAIPFEGKRIGKWDRWDTWGGTKRNDIYAVCMTEDQIEYLNMLLDREHSMIMDKLNNIWEGYSEENWSVETTTKKEKELEEEGEYISAIQDELYNAENVKNYKF